MDEVRRSIIILRGNDFNLIWGFSDAQGNPLNLNNIDYNLLIRSDINGAFPVTVDSIEDGVVRTHIDGEKIPVGKYYFDFSWTESSSGVKNHYRSKTDEIVTITDNIDIVSDYTTVNVDSIIVYVGASQSLKDVYVITSEDKTVPSDANVFSAKRSQKEFISKTSEDSTSFLLRLLAGAVFGNNKGEITKEGIARFLSIFFEDGLYSKDFSSGYLGTGVCVKVDENGDSYIEADRLFIRKFAEFVELLIQEIKHVGGQIILTPASMKCTGVEETDTYYRCHFKSTDGDRTIQNQFIVGDQARSQTFNIKEGTTHHAKNTYYWRLVTGVGEDYIDLSKSDCDNYSTIPKAGDDIVQLGNRNDPRRQTAIILSAYGSDAPSFKMYRNIKSYNLSDATKIVNISGEEVYFCADVFKFTNGKDVEQEVNNISGAVESLTSDITLANEAIENIQKQVDGVVEIWFYDDAPTLENEPAVNWTTDKEKNRHLGDMYYDADGNGYRFEKRDGQYVWGIISDTAILKALEAARKAQDTADGKKRVFVEQPTDSDAYDVGDLWVNATYEKRGYKNDLLRCSVTKTANSPFSINHWELASKYTDDTKANQAIKDAANAQSTADKAQKDADKANSELNAIASDNYITPSEKTALKQQQADIQAERNEIVANATKYGVSYTAYDAAYTLANNALTKYTASDPQNIGVESDYANISAYYAARKIILDAIATAAKKLVDDVQNDLQAYKRFVKQEFEAADGRLTSAITETKTYADQAVQAMPISGKNLFRDTKEGGHWYPNNWGGSDFSVEKITEAVTVGGHALNGYVRFLRNSTQGNGSLKTFAEWSPKITKADTRNRYVTVSFYARAEQRTAIYLNLCSGGNGEIAAEGEINKEAIISTEWEHKSVTFKTKDEPQYDGLWVWWSWYDAGIPLDMALFQVEFGNRASEWSPSADDVMDYTDQQVGKIPYSGRNLLQMWSIVPGYLSPVNGSVIPGGSAEDWDQLYDYIPVKPNEQLTMSLQGNIENKPDNVKGRFWVYNANKVAIEQVFLYGIDWTTPQSATFTMPSDAAFVRCSLIRGNWKSLWKLERGTKVTDWTPAPEDTAALIEQNASEIKQLPDSITFSVSKKITGGALNYVSGTQGNHETSGRGGTNQVESFGDRFIIHKECGGKYLSAAFRVRIEGCEFGEDARVTMQVNNQNGWNWYGLVAYEERGEGHGFALSDRGETFPLDGGLSIPYNGEYVIYSYDLSKPDIQGDGIVFVRFDYVHGGKITVSEIRVWETTDEERNAVNKEPLPWYPSRWDTGLLDSRITQTANDITLEVENRKSEDATLSSRIQQTAERISLKVERQIGGENLLYNSSFASDLVGWGVEGGSANMTAQIVNRDKTVDWLQGFPCLELWFNTVSKGIYRYLPPGIEGEGDAFTVSFDMLKRNPWPYQLIIGVEDSPQKYVDISNHPINEWRRVTVTQYVSRVGSQAILVYGGEGDGGVVYIKNMKVERGSVATSWCPAPSEQHDKLLATGIDIMNERIVLTANNTVIQSNSGQQIAMFTEDEQGKPWIKGENISGTNLTAERIITKPSGDNTAHVEIADSEINIFGRVARNIQFGVNDDGYAVLRYFDNGGRLLYDLGPEGIINTPNQEEKWEEVWLRQIGGDSDTINSVLLNYRGEYKRWEFNEGFKRYRYYSKMVAGVYEDAVNNGKVFRGRDKSSSLNGVFVNAPASSGTAPNFGLYRTDPNNPGNQFVFPGLNVNNEAVYNRYPLFFVVLEEYNNGRLARSQNAYWNG